MPSEASLSRFGVLPAIMPRWYAPMLNHPTSSPMTTRMLGFCCCAGAGVGAGACARLISTGEAVSISAAAAPPASRHNNLLLIEDSLSGVGEQRSIGEDHQLRRRGPPERSRCGGFGPARPAC